MCHDYRLSTIQERVCTVRNLGATSRGAACLEQPRGIFIRGWGEGRTAWEKEKSPEFGPQKALEASTSPSPRFHVSGQGGIKTAVSEGCLGAALRSTSPAPAFPSQQGFSLASWQCISERENFCICMVTFWLP